MRRKDDWPERLGEAIEAARNRGFRWGEHDCALFVADCVAAMTGVDPAAGLRGTYGARGAAVDLGKLGDRLFGPVIAATLARRGDVALVALGGDVALVESGGRLAAGVVIGGHVAVPGRDGLVAYPLAQATRAWRVG